EGVNLTPETASAYGAKLRALVGSSYPLIATVPRPSPVRAFPFAQATASFHAIAPMVYWENRDPATDVAGAIATLAPLGKPILPIGQAYNGAAEGGPDRDPPKEQIVAFMNTAMAKGAVGVSFWVWNHATADQWSAIGQAIAWELPAGGRAASSAAAVFLQRVLGVLGQPVAQDGMIGPATRAAIAAVQQSLGLPDHRPAPLDDSAHPSPPPSPSIRHSVRDSRTDARSGAVTRTGARPSTVWSTAAGSPTPTVSTPAWSPAPIQASRPGSGADHQSRTPELRDRNPVPATAMRSSTRRISPWTRPGWA